MKRDPSKAFPYSVLSFLVGVAIVSAGETATLTGEVPLPKSRKSAPVKVQRYQVVTSGGVLATNPSVAVVYLEGNFPDLKVPRTVQLAQENMLFSTNLLPIRRGTTVEFPNNDTAYHSVFSYSKAKRFDLGRFLRDERPVPSQLFDKLGLVNLHCDIHEHMRAIILVLDTPYFVKTNPNGSFVLSGLPTGNFKLKAWVNSKTTLEVPVVLVSGQTQRVDFSME
ncbi:MAG: plastocyanin [Verrucomicrobiales bacterium]|jgi:plastocyanin